MLASTNTDDVQVGIPFQKEYQADDFVTYPDPRPYTAGKWTVFEKRFEMDVNMVCRLLSNSTSNLQADTNKNVKEMTR